MQGIGRYRPLFAVPVFFLFLTLAGNASSPADGIFIWFADHKTANAIDVTTDTVVRRIELRSAPDAIAVDASDNGVWVLARDRLVKLDAVGAEARSIELKHIIRPAGHFRSLVHNPYSGDLWVASERTVMRLSPEGEYRAHWRPHGKIEAIALDLDESVWVLTHERLFHLSPAGELLESAGFEKHYRADGRHLAVDSLGGVIWVGGKQGILKFSLNRLADPPEVLSVPAPRDEDEKGRENRGRHRDKHERGKTEHQGHRASDSPGIEDLAVHPLFGTLWVASRNELFFFSRTGLFLKSVELPKPAKHARSIAFDARGSGLWVSGKRGLWRFSSDGELVASVETIKKVEALATAGFVLYPQVAIVDPSDGALTKNPRPRIRLSLGAQCTGTPCLLPDVYMRSLSLDVDLNGEAIGTDFIVDRAEAYYDTAAPLPEGANTLTATASDLFGHRAPMVSSRFTVDTVPPKFVSLSPADGSTFNSDALVISGVVDDSTANVIVADQGGSGISLGGAVFSFSVVLEPGPNEFVLIARDPAGNETTATLNVTYNPVSVTITRPTSGAVIHSRTTVVSGELEGPMNTGVTVNGIAASVSGSRFYVNLPLEPGPNTLKAVATSRGGASASDTITVSVDVPSVEPISLTVEPQSGIAPLTVRFRAESYTGESISELAIDTNGDGTVDLRIANPTDFVEHVYATPGVYEAVVTADGSGGSTATQAVAVVVNDGEQMDQMFTEMWGGMNDALLAGDIDGATGFLNEGAKRKYQPVFEALKPHFPEIIASYSPLRRVSISEDIGEYAVVRPNNGKNQLYLIYFLRDADGVWRVDAM